MTNIIFSDVIKNDIQSINKILKIFKEWKEIQFNNVFNKDEFENTTIEGTLKILEILDEKYNAKFWHPSKEELIELSEWTKKWQKLTVEEQKTELIKEKGRQPLWDFDSWIDAILSAEIIFCDFVEDGNNYKILLEQIAYPSGGIDAIENLIKIYDGKIIQNDMY
jgi:hypothetical protein